MDPDRFTAAIATRSTDLPDLLEGTEPDISVLAEIASINRPGGASPCPSDFKLFGNLQLWLFAVVASA